ncbi:MAG: phosphoribosylaminoimidazolesuccinocarboxamide synthase [Planctomycetes bacterium]|nr:phosphoribosylaminoimidazolesuccinocarboxamide synthase [Planctomycetota bacterium]
MPEPVVLKTEIPGLALFKRGKVRDVYDLGETLLIVATDRISCFDVVLGEGVPAKGLVLTAISRFWFHFFGQIPNHLVSTDLCTAPGPVSRHAAELDGRSMIVHKCQVIPVEWVVRGYLTGSAWKEYRDTGKLGEHKLPAGLIDGSRLPHAILTPTTKATVGHDRPLTLAEATRSLAASVAQEIFDRSLEIYEHAAKYAWEKGVVLADTKLEWGLLKGKPVIVDELLTPDSSRFWDRSQYLAHELVSYDKQFVRDYLEHVGWNKEPPPPPLPAEILERTSEKYMKLLELIAGSRTVRRDRMTERRRLTEKRRR